MNYHSISLINNNSYFTILRCRKNAYLLNWGKQTWRGMKQMYVEFWYVRRKHRQNVFRYSSVCDILYFILSRKPYYHG